MEGTIYKITNLVDGKYYIGPVADEMMALWGDEMQAEIGEVQL